MIFRKEKPKVTVNVERLKLQIEMIDHLLKYRFNWDDIEKGLGFSEAWYAFTKKLIEEKEMHK